jgi:Ca2+/H+ antiporter
VAARSRLLRSPIYWLLAFAPVTLALELGGAAPVWILVSALLAIIPFAGLIGGAFFPR